MTATAQVLTLAALLSLPHYAASAEQRPYEDLVCSYRWPCGEALRVMYCESSGNPQAVSAGGHLGLFQLAPMHAARIGVAPADLLDAEPNIEAAYSLWSAQGWAPWSCRP